MAEQAVTRLVVDADGALRTLGDFERGMDRAGRAAEQTTAAASNFEKRMAAVAAAQERGLAVTTQSVERVSREARAYENLAASVDPVYKLRIRLEREAAKAAVDATNAVIGGYETREGALRTLMALEQRHTAQLSAAASAANPAIAATNNLTNATQKLAAANDNASLNTANLAAQFQDIAVTAAMGMSPLQIALQQGTQIAGALGNQGAAGSVRALGAALVSLVSPVSLFSIGLTAAAAAAIQYFTTAKDGADKVSELLDAQNDIIRRAASAWGEAVPSLQRYVDQLERAKAISDGRAAADIFALREFDGVVEKLDGIKSKFVASMRDIRAARDMNGNADPAFLASYISAFSDLRKKLDDGTATSGDYARAQQALGEAVKRFGTSAVLEFRDAFDAITASIGRSIDAAKEARSEWIKAIAGADNVQDIISKSTFRDNDGKIRRPSDFTPTGPTPTPQARPKVELEGLPGEEKKLDKVRDGYRDLIVTANQRVDQMRAELELVGKAGSASEAYRFEQDLLSQAIENAANKLTDVTDATERWRQAQASITPDQREEIHRLALQYGELSQAIDEASAKANLLFERDQMGRSKTEQRVANELRRIYGDDYSSQMNGAIAGQIRLNEQWKQAQDELKSVGDIGKDALGGLLDILYESGDATEKLIGLFAGIGKKFAEMGLQNALKAVIGQGSGSGLNLGSLASAASSSASPERRVATVETGRQIGAAVAPVIKSSLSGAGGSMADILTSAAGKLGTTARDLATVISYETGGTFSTSAKNSSGHIGLIQFGKAEQQKYGVAIGQTFAKQMDAVVAFLQDRGFKPGMGMLDLYSTINAGRPGRYNAVDGTTTVRQKVETQFASHYGNADKLLGKKEVSDGMVDASRRMQQDAHVQAWKASNNPGTGAGVGAQGSSLENLLSAGGAAIGAFSGGYQSGSPIMGGISGAFTGAGAAPALAGLGLGAAAMPLGIVGGAVLGILGGFLGRAKQRRQEQKQAQQQLNQNKSALEELFARGEGRGLGATTQSYNEFYDKTAQLDEIAQKAGDDDLVKKLRDNVNKFFIILEKDYVGKFKGLAEAYSSGLGSNSPFVQGAAEMEQLREEVKNFVADARSFGELQLKNKRDLTPEQLEARVAEAERAAQKMILANISGVRELGQVEAGLLRLDGVAVAAKTSLEQLGMTAEEAAKAVDGQLNVAIAKLKDNLLRDLTSSLNDLSGVGFLNDIMDAQVLYQQRLDDASRLGIDGSLALRELSLSIGEIVKQAGLGASEIAMLSEAFPTLQFILNGVSTSTMTLTDATSDLQAAYDKEASALDDLISASKSGIAAIKAFRDAMKINDNSPLSPADKVAEAAKQFRDLADKAAGGDAEALGQLTQIGQDYLDEARSYYASSTGYFDIWTEVDATLARVQSATEGQLSKAEQQKKALDASVAGILDINTSVKSVAEALAQYNATQAAGFENLAAQLALGKQVGTASIEAAYQANLDRSADAGGLSYYQGQIAGGKTVDQVVDAIANSREAQINALYKQVFGRALDAESRDFWVNSGKSIDQIASDLNYAKTQGAYRNGGIVGAFARGGMVGNGTYDVDSVRARYAGGGEILLAGGEFVNRAGSVNNRTYPTLDYINRTGNLPGNDNAAVVAAVNRLVATTEEVKEALRLLALATAEGSGKQTKVAERTAAAVNEMADELKRANSRGK